MLRDRSSACSLRPSCEELEEGEVPSPKAPAQHGGDAAAAAAAAAKVPSAPEGAATQQEQQVWAGICCSPRHRIPYNLRDEGLRCDG